MYLKNIRSNKESFRPVSFERGFNVVIAERAEGSTERDSRNGLGKSTLIEIIHFCLGADSAKSLLNVPELSDWMFTLDFELDGRDFTVSRDFRDPNTIFLDGDFTGWTVTPELSELHGAHILTNEQWCEVLGNIAFGLSSTERKYSPSFRSLFSYFARRGTDGYQDPHTFFRSQPEYSKQINNAYLLGLSAEYASKFQEIKDLLGDTKQIKKATGQGYFKDLVGSLGELEAERVTRTQEIQEFRSQLQSFKVHPQYNALQVEADKLTKEIQETLNSTHLENVLARRYEESLGTEEDVSLELVSSVYQEAGLHFAERVNQTLESVSDFHKTILSNRRTYLETEIERLNRSIATKQEQVEALTEKRSEALSVLQSHGALEEHARLSGRLALLEGELENVKNKIANLKEFDEKLTALEIQKKDLVRLAKQDKEEKSEIIDSAIAYFNESARALYEGGGILAIDIKDSGYSFKTEIQRGRSQGIGYMKVFSYDLSLAQLHARFFSPKTLIHDSTVFDGVDERQFARALELAAEKSQSAGFQYICLLNSDVVPVGEFSENFKVIYDQSIRLRLTDNAAEGSLLGFRYS